MLYRIAPHTGTCNGPPDELTASPFNSAQRRNEAWNPAALVSILCILGVSVASFLLAGPFVAYDDYLPC